MNKESIYRIIGYNGEYNDSVKKAIRKLLKDNHPDNHGNRKVFELINEVKKELEDNRVSFAFKKEKNIVKVNDDIDYTYCYQMINSISKEIMVYKKELEEKKQKLSESISEYEKHYHQSIDLETYLLHNSYYKEQLRNIKISCIVFLILAIIAFIISVITKKIVFLAIFIFLAFICVIIIHKAFFIVQKIADNHHHKIKNYVGVNTKIRHSQEEQENLKKEIHLLNKKINNLEDNLRFYNNVLNNRG